MEVEEKAAAATLCDLPAELLEKVLSESARVVCLFVCKDWNHHVRTHFQMSGPQRDFASFIAKEGEDLHVLDWAVSLGCTATVENCGAAAYWGHLNFVRWARSMQEDDWKRSWYAPGEVALQAARGGRVEVLEWLKDVEGVKRLRTLKEKAIAMASYAGQIGVLRWFIKDDPSDPRFRATAVRNAAAGGQLHVLDWLWNENMHTMGFDMSLQTAAAYGVLPALERLLERALSPSPSRSLAGDLLRNLNTYTTAVRNGNLNVLQWGIQHGYIPLLLAEPGTSPKIYLAAVESGKLDILEWVADNIPCPPLNCGLMGEAACRIAAGKENNLELLMWLRERGYQWESTAFRNAARNGRLETLEYLRENECPCDESIYGGLAARGHKEFLEWALEDDDTLSESKLRKLCRRAAEGGHLEVVVLLRSAGCQWDERIFQAAVKSGSLRLLAYLRVNGCEWNAMATQEAALRGDLEVLRSLRGWGCPWDEGCCRSAALRGHVEVLEWARANGCPCPALRFISIGNKKKKLPAVNGGSDRIRISVRLPVEPQKVPSVLLLSRWPEYL